ncbi:MAG: phenylalanine--tRNA ligase subunit beta [Clostridia bacterium]|nr:phenylalanine--tRNA ligase subunit beta [Clostridia bacterium]
MKIPMSWLSDYTDISGISPEEYNHALTMTGSKVEGIENIGDSVQNVVTAKIMSVEKHPDADKLKVCQVDTGKEQLQIITGADNVKPGQIVPVALDGAILPGGVKIKNGKLRGLPSYGMMCSYEEIGMTKEDFPDAEYGILILDENLPLGKDIREVFGLNENIVEFEITSNRPDCLSVIGLARETAVTFGRPFSVKAPEVKGAGDDISNYIKISVNDTDLCPRYSAKVIKNVKIGPSPKWMVDRLKASGIRSINNIVDITNYVLLEYGQPMHAFDLNYVSGNEIIVRRAKDGEEIVSLDGETRKLDSSMLMICDAKNPSCIAGVMGGEHSEVTEETKTILFESANFFGTSVRRTAQKLGLRTESSARYEKGLDANNTIPALLRACELVELLGAGEVVDGMIDIDHSDKTERRIAFDPAKINAFLGCDVKEEDMVKSLTALGFKVEKDEVIVPSFRADVEGFADVAEEVVRIFGYDKIPSTLMRSETVSAVKTPKQMAEDKVRDILTACGMYEIITYSFTNPNLFDKLLIDKDSTLRNVVKISNPLGEENSIMRTTALSSMMETLARNANFKADKARLFELAKIYLPVEGEQLPNEEQEITLGMFGACDFFDLKGIVEALLLGMNVGKVRFVPLTDDPTFHPGRAAELYIGNEKAGVLGQIHPAVCDNYDISGEVYAAQISFEAVFGGAASEKQYQPLPKYPAVVRDLAILVDEAVLAAEVEEIIKKKAKNLFAGLTLFDVYQGKQVPEGKKSMAYSLTLQSDEKTLTDEDTTGAVQEILEALKSKLGAELR